MYYSLPCRWYKIRRTTRRTVTTTTSTPSKGSFTTTSTRTAGSRSPLDFYKSNREVTAGVDPSRILAAGQQDSPVVTSFVSAKVVTPARWPAVEISKTGGTEPGPVSEKRLTRLSRTDPSNLLAQYCARLGDVRERLVGRRTTGPRRRPSHRRRRASRARSSVR